MRSRLLVIVTLAETGGAQTFVRSLVNGLRARYEVEVAAHGPGGALADACAALGVPFHHLTNLVRNPDPRRDLLALVEIRKLVHRVRPDLVQINSTKAGMLGRLALIATRTPVVFTAHGWAFSGRRGSSGFFATAVERTVAPLTAAIVCVSNWDLKLAIERGIATSSRLQVIHNGIAAPELPPARDPWPAEPVVVCVARLAPPKDVGLLLNALADRRLSAWRLKVVGDGPERAALKARAAALGMAERVQMLGDRSDVPDLLARADAFVLPTKWEGLPYSVLEAMAAGLPVVASRVGGVPELVIDGETGLLVERDSVSELAIALHRLGADGTWARELGRAGHARARHHFSLDAMIAGYDGLFQSLIAPRATASTRPRGALQ